MSNKGLLIVITIVLVGILSIMVIQMNEKTPAEKFGDSVSEAIEEFGDEIDDNTTAP